MPAVFQHVLEHENVRLIRKGIKMAKEKESNRVNQENRGDVATFVIRVQHRQNNSSQGTITWMDKNQTLRFRSMFELMKLIDEASEMSMPLEEKTPSWKD